MRFSLHGGSTEEVAALKSFAELLGAGFVAYDGLPGEEPLLTVQCLPRKLDLMRSIEQVTRWHTRGGLLSEGAPGVQNPPPDSETPRADDPTLSMPPLP